MGRRSAHFTLLLRSAIRRQMWRNKNKLLNWTSYPKKVIAFVGFSMNKKKKKNTWHKEVPTYRRAAKEMKKI
jgi:hypothetical protein